MLNVSLLSLGAANDLVKTAKELDLHEFAQMAEDRWDEGFFLEQIRRHMVAQVAPPQRGRPAAPCCCATRQTGVSLAYCIISWPLLDDSTLAEVVGLAEDLVSPLRAKFVYELKSRNIPELT